MKTDFHFCREQGHGRAVRLFSEVSVRQAALTYRGWIAGLMLGIAANCGAQTVTVTAPTTTQYSIVSRGPNERVWQRTTVEVSASGQTNSYAQSYTEVASSLCYMPPGQNSWLDSAEIIGILPDGASATNGQTRVHWPADIFSGSIQLQNGATALSVQPQCLVYSDGTNYVVWATLTNSVGELVSTNQILFPGAFRGCDLLYTYRKSGIESDLVFRKQPPAPEAVGLNSANVKMQLWTAFYDSPAPTETPEPVDPQAGLQDNTLSFGSLTMIQGRAFLTGSGNDPQIPVFKEFHEIDAQTSVLVEQVPLNQIAASLATLPAVASADVPLPHGRGSVEMASGSGLPGDVKGNRWQSGSSALPGRRLHKVSEKWVLPVARRSKSETTTNTVKVTRIGQTPGFVLDYVAINSGQSLTNFLFASDQTFYVSGPAYMYGETVIQGGVVIKASGSGAINIMGNGTLDCQTGPYLPGLFTSYRDSTVGSSVGSGSPAVGDVTNFLNFYSTNVVLHDLHFAYAWDAVNQTMAGSTASINLWDCEFVDVATAVNAYNVGLYNVLIGRSAVTNAAVIVDGAGIVGENVTADNGGAFIQANQSGASIALTNCLVTRQPLLAGAGAGSATLQTNYIANPLTLLAPVYAVSGGGSYYLTNSSPYTNAGTLNINADLLADLQQKTVSPPIVYGDTNISLLGPLGPVTQRDTNSLPAIGFHYATLDLVFAGCELTNGLSFSPGTAVGWFEEGGPVNVGGEPYSISLNSGANLSFNGNATEPCIFARYVMVQEGANGNWTGDGWMGAIAFDGGSVEPQLSANFTKVTSDNWNGNTFRDDAATAGAGTFKNSEFYNFTVSTYNMTSLVFTNCLFYRFNQSYWTSPALAFENCTFYNGGIYMGRSSPVNWLFENCSFDGTAFAWSDSYNGTSHTAIDHNAYNTNNPSWTNYPYFTGSTKYGTNEVGTNDLMVTNYNWEAWFGDFYLPANSPLIRKGGTNANVLGLAAFTTQTNQNPDGTNLVDIGYHYMALPVISEQPADCSVFQGDTAIFSVTATGPEPLNYQWNFGGTALAGQTNSILILTNIQYSDRGDYWVLVSNAAGGVGSSNAVLTVLEPPSIVLGPTNQMIVVGAGNPAYFSATNSGANPCGGPFAYEWLHDGTNIGQIITTFAGQGGNPGYYGEGVLATNAQLGDPSSVALDLIGDVYIADPVNNVIRMVNSAGVITTVAGDVPSDSGGAGLAIRSVLSDPDGVTADVHGNLYIADSGNNVIRMVDTNGVIKVVAGTFGSSGNSGDGGPATSAFLNGPYGVAFDSLGNLYIADTDNQLVRKVNTNGIITTVAGNRIRWRGYSGDGGLATNAALDFPQSVAVGPSGNLYIADSGNNVIRMVDGDGDIWTVAGISNDVDGGYSGDGYAATNAQFNGPEGIAFDSRGNLYIADTHNDAIRMMDTNGDIWTVAGTNNQSGGGDNGYTGDGGAATNAHLYNPQSVTVDSVGNLYIADSYNDAIRIVSTNGVIWTIAGTNNESGSGYPGYLGDGGPATNALLDSPYGVAVSSSGGLYFSDSENKVVRMVNSSGIITTVAGVPSGEQYFGDGVSATNAILNGPEGVAEDGNGNLFIADTANDVVRKVDTTGIITTVAGTPLVPGYSGDSGAATSALLNSPAGVALDWFGDIYIADSGNNVVRMVDTNGFIWTVAGTNYDSGHGGVYSGDGGPATNAFLNDPQGVALDNLGNLYIADTGNEMIRKVGANGIISAFAGTNNGSELGDGGPATNAMLFVPTGVAVDSSDNLYIADSGNQLVRMVDTNGIISTVAGIDNGPLEGDGGYSGDGGPATRAQLWNPSGVAADAMGQLYIADLGNSVVRKTVDNSTTLSLFNVTTNDLGAYQFALLTACGSVTSSVATLNPVVLPVITVPPTNIEVILGSNAEFSATATGTPPLSYQWCLWTNSSWVPIDGATNANLIIPDVETNDDGSYGIIVTNAAGPAWAILFGTLTVIVPPVITQQPTGGNALEGNNFAFSVTASSVAPLGYQWYFDATDLLAGQTNSILTLTNVESGNGGSFSVVVTNCAGSVTSQLAALTVQARPYVAFNVATNVTNFVFASDSTFFINSTVNLYSNTVIEGGTVLKFSSNGTLNVLGPLICKTGPFRPAYLTSMDDDSAGVPISGSTADPQTATNGLAYLNFEGWNWDNTNAASTVLSCLRFAYADKALADESGLGGSPSGTHTATLHIWNCQFVDCNWGIADWCDTSTAAYDLHNILFGRCQSAFGGWSSTNTILTGEQLTSDTANFWDTTSNTVVAVSLTNCIILGNFQFSPSTVVSTNFVALASSENVFQSVGAGNYYLSSGSSYRHAGTANISPQMAAELAQKTTYPPNVDSDQDLGSQGFASQVPRDNGVSSIPGAGIGYDLGWHYDPIDIAVSGVNVVNSTVNVGPGTVIAAFASYSQTLGDTYGLNIDGGSRFTCQGLANNLNHIVQFNTVQEQATSDWCEAFDGSVVCDFLGETPSPSLTFRFTDWSIIAFDTYHLDEASKNCLPVNFQNCCQFHGGLLASTYATMNFTNCLFERVYASLDPSDGNTPTVLNNLFWHGTFDFDPKVTNALVQNNLFDQTAIPNNSGTYSTYNGGCNAFVTNQDRLYPTNFGDVVLTNALAYETSYFGNYYQPTNSPLLNAGSMSAAQVGLYHYTVTTNQTIEASNTVSIGLHYVATDTNGNPYCTSGNGIPDYIADTNGNGQGDWVDYYQGQMPLLFVVYGDGQYGLLTNFLYAPLVVEVTDDQYNPLTNAPLTFSVSNALDEFSLTNTWPPGIIVSNLYLRTDQNGYATVYVYFPLHTPATNMIYATAESDGTNVEITSTDFLALVDTPVINPAGGRFPNIQNVTISSDTSGAVVHYTLDGASPTETNSIITNGQTLAIIQPTTIEAQGFEDALMLPSSVQTASFSFANPLAAGSNFTLVLEPYGSILSGGSGGSGQLGDGTTTASSNLFSVLDITNAEGIAAGGLHSLAWDSNGDAWAWGSNTNGQLGIGSSGNDVLTATQINSLNSIKAMSGGYLHSLALESNGLVYAWGYNANGQLGNNSTAQQDSPVRVDIISNVIAIAAGGSHSLALASNGMVYVWGNNASGQLGDGTEIQRTTPVNVVNFSNCLEIAAGFSHSVAIASNETVVAWGDNTYGQMGNGSTSTSGQSTPKHVLGLSNVVAIAAGRYHSLALSNGIVWAWGNNTYGQLGNGTTNQETTPVPVVGLSNVLAIAAGYAHSAALLSDGNVVIWGETNYGMNGIDSGFSTVPVIPDPDTNVDWQPPVIISQPLSQEVVAGDTVTFSVGAVGYNLTYQWAINGSPISGATASTYSINNVQVNNQGAYTVTVANEMASVVSTNAVLTVDWWDATGDPFLTSLDEGARQDYTFQSGVTYDIDQPVQLYGQTTIEPGAVIKFDYVPWVSYGTNYGFTNPPTLQVFGSLICKGTPYNPAILTSVDDDGSGELLWWDSNGPFWTGNDPEPFRTGVPFLDLTEATTNISLNNVRIAYADQGVATPAGQRLDCWDCQFVTNNSAVMNLAGGTNSFHNVLFSGCLNAVTGSTNPFTIEAEQITACANTFWTASNGASVTVSLTNSIILGALANGASQLYVKINPPLTNFQASAAGSYYLSCNSSLHASGTTTISQRLLNEFQNKTTSAPLAFPALMQMNGTMTLFPRVPRYTNGPPDIGYYYDALDYSVADMILSQGSLTVEPGTAIGSRMDFVATNDNFTYIGFDMQNNSGFTSVALPNKPNVFTDVQSVQEGFEWPVMGSFVPDFFPSDESAGPPVLNFRFTDFYLNYCGYVDAFLAAMFEVDAGEPADHIWGGETIWTGSAWSYDTAVFLTLQNCQVQGGAIDLGFPDWGYYFPPDYVYGNAALACTNDSFDDVGINISPTWNSYGLDDRGPNVKMTVSLDNSLVKGGDWFFIEPIPLSEEGLPNWLFENNLFDKPDILQDASQPLDYAYNAYWPRQPWELLYGWDEAELQPTTTGDDFTDGTGEVVLSNAPPYQCGPFGNFYMTTNTQLFGAGSTSATNLALYHFTTQPDQVIEGDEPAGHNVDIGVHYVPATNVPATSLYEPVDTDGDGIPDYVEDADGNGIVDTNDGTSWLIPFTLPGIWDPTNAVYMSTDFSGDGLVNSIKMALGLSPFCQTNPLTLTQVPTGDEPNTVAFEVPINYNSLTNIGKLNLNVNGIDATVQNLSPATDGNCLLVWDTTFDPPGQEYLQVCLGLNSPIQNNNAVLSAYGPLYPFLSTNVLQFFEAGSMFTAASASLNAQLSVSHADYIIGLYDPSTSPWTWIMSITNSTTTGIISEDWGVTNASGAPYTGNNVEAAFNVMPAGTSGQGTPYPRKPLTRAAGQLTEWGPNFDFTYVWTAAPEYWYDLNGGLWNSIQPIVDELITPTSTGNESENLAYYNSDFDYYSTELAHANPWDYGTTVGYPGYLATQNYVTNPASGLLQDLTNGLTKNFYFYGHGTEDASALENFAALVNADPSVRIMSDTLIQEFGNGPFWDTNGSFTGFQYRYPYRFVFLDACYTTKSRTWYETFGTVPDDQAVNNIGPQAFVGWEDQVDAAEANGLAVGQAYFGTVQMLYYLWLSDYTVQQCIDYCSDPKNTQVPFPVAANHGLNITVDGETWTYTFTPRLIIVGHAGLKIDGLNSDLDYIESSHIMYGSVPKP